MKALRLTPTEILALLQDGKTQLRRAMKPQPPENEFVGPEWYAPTCIDRHGEEYDGAEVFGIYSEDGEWGIPCPFQPGSQRWVQETFALAVKAGVRQIAYAADGRWYSQCADWERLWHGYVTGVTDKRLSNWTELSGHWVGRGYFGPWRPSVQMPKRSSRLTVEITAVGLGRDEGGGLEWVVDLETSKGNE